MAKNTSSTRGNSKNPVKTGQKGSRVLENFWMVVVKDRVQNGAEDGWADMVHNPWQEMVSNPARQSRPCRSQALAMPVTGDILEVEFSERNATLSPSRSAIISQRQDK